MSYKKISGGLKLRLSYMNFKVVSFTHFELSKYTIVDARDLGMRRKVVHRRLCAAVCRLRSRCSLGISAVAFSPRSFLVSIGVLLRLISIRHGRRCLGTITSTIANKKATYQCWVKRWFWS